MGCTQERQLQRLPSFLGRCLLLLLLLLLLDLDPLCGVFLNRHVIVVMNVRLKRNDTQTKTYELKRGVERGGVEILTSLVEIVCCFFSVVSAMEKNACELVYNE